MSRSRLYRFLGADPPGRIGQAVHVLSRLNSRFVWICFSDGETIVAARSSLGPMVDDTAAADSLRCGECGDWAGVSGSLIRGLCAGCRVERAMACSEEVSAA